MAANIYITSLEPQTGKSIVTLGIMEMLLRNIGRVGFFRPVVRLSAKGLDKDTHLMVKHCNLPGEDKDYYAFDSVQAGHLFSGGKQNQLTDGILKKYAEIQAKNDFVCCLGSDFEGSTSAIEFAFNADVALNLGAPVVLVASGKGKSIEDLIDACRLALESYFEKGLEVIALFVNRCAQGQADAILNHLKSALGDRLELIYTLEDSPDLRQPQMREVADFLNAQVIYGENQLGRAVFGYEIAAMQLRNFLPRLKEGNLIITPGDRLDVLLGSLMAFKSQDMPSPAGVLLTGGILPEKEIVPLLTGLTDLIPIVATDLDTYEAAETLTYIRPFITPESTRKIAIALSLFESRVEIGTLRERIIAFCTAVITPKMFEFRLIQKAASNRQTIVLPEGDDERILQAAEILSQRKVVDLVILGNIKSLENTIAKKGFLLKGVTLMQPDQSEHFEAYAAAYQEMRKHKGITLEMAKETMRDVSYFGTMMVQMGHAQGMVSGAAHTTQHTIRPSFEIIKTKPGSTIASSVFFMCLEDRVLVYGDCAVNPNPNPSQLAEIALASAETAKAFGISPRVAMLSYSTGESGKGEDVEAVAEATKLAKARAPGLALEGPMQYDAATDVAVGQAKMPGSKVAGHANVFIFPDLNTGNNTYKAVQRSANAVAIGPVMQGMNKPVNDLSRGCTVPDIINTIAITAIQAQQAAEQEQA